MLACTALVGCTNEDVIDNPNENLANGKNDAYVSVRFIMSDANGSRATADGGYDVGSEAEQAITVGESIFLFYDANGQYVTSGNLVGSVSTNENGEGNHNEHSTLDKVDVNAKFGEVFIAISASDGDIDKITQVLTVVNYNNITGLLNKPLSDALTMTTTETNDPSNDGFLMTTSVYFDESNKLVQTTAISQDNIKENQADALKAPVNIYIERVSAKVGLTVGSNEFAVEPGDKIENSNDSNQEADVLYNGTLTPAKVMILGYTVNNTNETTNLVKQVENTWNEAGTQPFAGWNQATNFRSYWAKGTQWEYTGFLEASTSTTGDDQQTTITPNEHKLAVKTFQNALTNKFTDMYCYEQTVKEDNVDEDRTSLVYYPNVTTVLVAAQVLMGNATTAETLYKYSGVYYNAENYQKLIKSRLTAYTKDDGTHYAENEWVVTLEENTENEFSVTVSTIEGVTAPTNLTAEDYSDIVKGTEVYTDGYCYYQIPIEHLSSTDGKPLYGVVRNHWYKLEISAVKHIGEPVYNVNDEIPEIPEKDAAHYLAAKIHVLSWHVVNQNVTLD